ncbi:YadA-like family protein [Gallibacterium genomosp. 3]|uniref:Uncharacterized protein n=1 Tax=Gallibacterium genomosp. 3 TaxID=505345 RepID=A0A1A7Q5M2_9PAST|nr:YadA-like family protein [Gallibacterium genomosp. 3]OBX08720.1 hypothetical protein QV07_05655 [Gallibacterium genomosp. 3]
MNKIYKTKYSVAKKEIVVVSELTASHGKETSSVGQNNKKINFSTKLSMITLAILSMGLLSSSFVVAQTLIMKNGSIYAQEKDYFDNYNERKFVALNPAKNNETSNPGAVGKYSVSIGNDSTAAGEQTVAIGYSSIGSGNYSVVIGREAKGYGDNSIVIGSKSRAFEGEATVVGVDSGAGSQAVALGANVYAQGYSSIAIGSDDPIDNNVTNVKDKYGVKFPKGTLISIYQDLWTGADGKKFFTDENSFLSSYWDNNPDGTTNEKAIWSPTYAKKLGAIAIGTRTIAGGEVSTSIGTLSFALADRSTAMGIKAYVDTAATGGTAIGESSRIFASNSVAIGNKTEATSQGAMAYGYQAYAVGKNSIAIGSQVAASAKFYTANTASLGETYDKLSQSMTSLNGDNASINTNAYKDFDATFDELHKSGLPIWVDDSKTYLTIGKENIKKTLINSSDSENSIVIGGRSYAVKKNSLAVGYSTLADADNSFAIGSYTYVTSNSNNSIGIGVGAYVNGSNSFLAGTQSRTASERTVVLGPFSKIGSNSSRAMTFGYLSAIGNNSKESVALGALSKISDNVVDSMAFGTLAKVDATQTTVVANGNSIINALAIGKDAIVRKGINKQETGNNAIALGVGAVAMLENSVALGVNSKTDYKYDDLQKDPWVAKGATSVPTSGKTGVISVGAIGAERRITNVASGRLDTDAVNVAQLKTIDEKFDVAIESLTNGGGVQYLSIEHTNSTGEAGQISAKIKLGENYSKYVNLKKTLKYIEARQKLNDENFNTESLDKLKATLQKLQDDSVTAGLTGGYASLTTNLDGIIVSGDFQTVMDKITAAAETDSNKSVNGLTPEQIVALKKNNNYLNDGAEGIDSIAFGFGAKTSGEDSGNKGKHAVAIGYKAEANGENAIAIGNLAKALGARAISIGNANQVGGGISTLSGEGAGALGDSNYINGMGTYAIGNNNGITSAHIDATNSGFFGNSNKTTTAAMNVRVIGNLNTISADNVMVFGNNITANVSNSVYLGNYSALSKDLVDSTAGLTAYTKYSGSIQDINDLFKNYTFAGVGSSTNGAVSVGAVGAERRIQNVAAGLISATSTDAINGSQLYATNDLLGKLATTQIKLTGNNQTTSGIKLYSPNSPLNFNIQGDGTDLISTASDSNTIQFSLSKNTALSGDGVVDTKTATTEAIRNAIIKTKTTVTQTSGSPYLTVIPNVSTGLTANAYSIAFNYEALKTNLTDNLPFAKLDASNLTQENVTAWKDKLGLNNLSPNIGYKAEEDGVQKTVRASTGLTFVSKDKSKLVITAKEGGIVEFESKGITASELDNKLSGLSSTLKIAGDGSSTGSVDLKEQTLGVKGTSGEIETTASGQNVTLKLASDLKAKINNVDNKLDRTDLTNQLISDTLTKGNIVASDTVSVKGTGTNRLLGTGDLSFDIVDGSITDKKLAAGAVTSDKITDGAVTTAKLGSDVDEQYIDTTELANSQAGKANTDLSNLANAGKDVITGLVDVVKDPNTADNLVVITPETDNASRKKTFKIGVNKSDVIAAAGDATLKYAANGANAKTTALKEGLNFSNGTNTTATVEDSGVVKYSVNTANLTNNEQTGAVTVADGSDGNNFATASSVASAITTALGKVSSLNLVADTENVTGKVDLATENLGIKGSTGYIVTSTTKDGNDITIDLDQKVKDQLTNISTTAGNAATKSLDNIDNAGKDVITGLITASGNDDVNLSTSTSETSKVKNITASLNKSTSVTEDETKVVTSGAVYDAIKGAKATITEKSDSNEYLTVTGTKSDDITGNTFTVGLTDKATQALAKVETATANNKGLADTDLSNITEAGKTAIKNLTNVIAKAAENNIAKVTPTEVKGVKTYEVEVTKESIAQAAAEATLKYAANGANEKTTALKNGLNFQNGTNTVAEVSDNGVVKYNLSDSISLSNVTASGTVTAGSVKLGTGKNAPVITANDNNVNFGNAKLTGIAAGSADTDAVNVGQLKDLGIAPDKAVVTYDDLSKTSISLGQKGANGEAAQPVVINNVASGLGLDGKGADGNGSTTAPEAISPKKANEAVATLLNTKGEALNKVANVGDLQAVAQAGLDFIGNEGNTVHRALGTTLSIKGDGNKAADFASAIGNLNVVNLNDELTIQLAKSLVNMTSFTTDKTPDGKQVALDASGLTTSIETNGKTVKSTLGADRLIFNDGKADSVTIDGVNKSITGLAKRDINSENYGTSGNETRAATEGAVKGLADAIGIGSSNTNILPIDGQNGASGKDGLNGTSILDKVQALRDGTAGNMVYTDQEGNRLVQLADGFYKLDDVVVGDDGHYRPKEGTKAVETDNILISAVDANGETTSPTQLANVKSGLGLTGSADNSAGGDVSNPQALNVDAAQKVIAGDSKDGQGGLLTASGSALNKVATVGDLQALAQAGLDFVGNDEKVVHRPLGTKLSIVGEGIDKNASKTFNSASGNINVVNNVDNTLMIQLAKALTNISSIGGSVGQGKISFDKGAVNFNDNVITGIKSAVSEPTEGKDYLDALANADNSSAVNVSDLKNVTEALGNKLTDAGLSFAGDSGNNVTRKLGETLSIKGGVTDVNKLTDNNIGVVADGSSSLNVKLSSELKDMTSFETAANADGTSTKLDANGIKVTGQDGKSAEYGLDGSTIANKEGSATYGANDVTFKDANNKELIKLDAANNAIVVNGKDGKDGITINGETKTITGLDQRTINGEDYGKGDNRGNAATEGAVKDLADAIGVGSTNTLPVDGATGAGGKDGLNGTSILDKVQALRDGTAGNAVYTTESGERLIKLEQDGKPVYYKESDVEKAADGRYIAKEGVNSVPTDQIVISAVNPDGSTTEATKLANVASSIGGEVKSDSNSFIDNLNKVGATGDGSVNPNTAVTAQDLKNLADTGFKLQTNDNGVNTVKAGNTVQVKDGINTKVSKVEEKAGVFSYSINVNGVPMTYVNEKGKALAKVGDRFFLLKDNGELDLEGSTPENTKIAGVALVDPQGGSKAQTLDKIEDGELKADSKQAVNGGQIANILGTDAEGKAITTNIGGTGKDNIDSAIKAVKTASVSEVTAGDNVEINTVESDSGKKVSISTSMNPNFDTVGLGAIRDQDGKLQPRISLGVTKDGALAVAGADGKSPVRITNVADPVQDSDAVNKRYVDMNNRKLRGGIAGAIATASLPQAYTSGKSLFAVSGGTYGGQSAVALGVSRISDNGKMIIKLVGSTNTQGSVSGGVGVGFEW